MSDDQLPVSCPSELALEEICRLEGDDTDDMDTDNVSWLWLINNHEQTERTVYWQQAGFPTEKRQRIDSVFCPTEVTEKFTRLNLIEFKN